MVSNQLQTVLQLRCSDSCVLGPSVQDVASVQHTAAHAKIESKKTIRSFGTMEHLHCKTAFFHETKIKFAFVFILRGQQARENHNTVINVEHSELNAFKLTNLLKVF